jgi:hypothetical protein
MNYVVRIQYQNRHGIYYANGAVIVTRSEIIEQSSINDRVGMNRFAMTLPEAEELWRYLLTSDENYRTLAVVRITRYPPYMESAVSLFKEVPPE